MKRLFQRAKTFYRSLLLVAVSWSIWLSTAGVALAKRAEIEEPETKSYVAPYMLVALFLFFGLVVVCRPTTRASEIKLKDDDDE